MRRNGNLTVLFLFLIGWNIWFFADFLMRVPVLMSDLYAAPKGVIRFTVTGQVMMIIASVMSSLLGGHRRIRRTYRVWILLYLCWIVLVMANGFYLENSPLSILNGIVGLLFPLYIYVGNRTEYWNYFIKILVVHQTCAVIFGMFFLMKFRLIQRIPEYTMPAVITFNYLYATPFLLLYWSKLKSFGKIAAIGGFLACLGIGISAQFRGIIISAVLLLCFGLYAYLKDSSYYLSRRLRGVITGVLTVVALGSILSFWGMTDPYFSESASNLYYRFQMDESDTIRSAVTNTVYRESRLEEARLFLREEMKGMEWVLGHGLGARWWLFGSERSIVHIGFVHMLFVGGAPLLLLFLYCPFKAALFTRASEREGVVFPYKILILLWFIELFYYGIPDGSLKFVLIGLSMGLLVSKGDLSTIE